MGAASCSLRRRFCREAAVVATPSECFFITGGSSWSCGPLAPRLHVLAGLLPSSLLRWRLVLQRKALALMQHGCLMLSDRGLGRQFQLWSATLNTPKSSTLGPWLTPLFLRQ